jgi:flagellar biosynthesis protein FlhF
MNLKRFTARTSREALALVRQAFGDDAIVMSTKPCAGGVEVLAMAPESLQQIERLGATAASVRQPELRPVLPQTAALPRPGDRLEPSLDAVDPEVAADVKTLEMSTLSFQDFVRDRMLRRRSAEQAAASPAEPPVRTTPPTVSPIEAARTRLVNAHREPPVLREEVSPIAVAFAKDPVHAPQPAPLAFAPAARSAPAAMPTPVPAIAPRGEQIEMLTELRSMRGMIEQRFGALAFMEKLQRQPRQALLAQRLLDTGFSPALIRKLVDSLPVDVDEVTWAASVLERNLATAERDSALEDVGGVYALIGATGVGKTTSTAKLAAAFAARHGASQLGLVTLDAYRVGAHEQLRTYGRILGVPVHTAHDRASLEDLLDLLSAKKMVLIDTAGMAQRDSRTRELLDMLAHRAIHRLLVVNASAQGETIEDQLAAYDATSCRGVVLSKMDEAVKLGPALDSMIRHKLTVVAVANGQRVPEDWHRLSANALMQRAMKNPSGPAWRLDDHDVSLIFAGLPLPGAAAPAASMLHA